MISINKLKNRVVNYIGCSTQHNGWPCNSCFHTTIEVDFKDDLNFDVHDYWLAVLAIRGDYLGLEQQPALIEELYNILGGQE